MGEKIQRLPGFRDFFPEDCAVRNYVFGKWREISRLYGFHEYDGPVLEPTDLYKKKSGDEILGQLFHFDDRGARGVAMRPELTPTLARMAAARQRDYKKPLRWFGIGQFFRYEKPQKGRTREFYQLNADILGEESKEADSELIAFAIDLMLALGFTKEDFIIRLSDREAWLEFMRQESIDSSSQEYFLQTIDKIEREKDEATNAALVKIGTTREAVQNFIDSAADNKHFSSVIDNLQARGLSDYVKVDLNVVRGLAYYTGTVFEVFDTNRNMRAIAGGGRYNKLCSLISDGAADIPACGFAMGDVVITDLIKQTKSANTKLLNYLGTEDSSDAYIIIADESHRNDALSIAQLLRNNGYRVSYPLAPTKVGKQFGNAENLKSRTAVIIGSEYPKIKVKDLIQREEIEIETDQILKFIESIKNTPPEGPLLAE
ncbi:MAG: histidine--tRNA ligase [Verrucomicrobiales bacterium]|jgi:histidyl-tRNA synthetase|nr:histidine--tRNA ligase [Verrucomicrobiales bacterium]